MKHLGSVIIAVALLSAATACVRPPAPLAGTFPEINVRDAQEAEPVGSQIRWGGSIVSVTPRADKTCFEIVSHPLDGTARPRETDETDGRFIACAAGFYDPAVYEPGRDLTVVGTVVGSVEGKIGEREYRFPNVDAEQVYLWPKRDLAVMYPPAVDLFWYPYWSPSYRRRW